MRVGTSLLFLLLFSISLRAEETVKIAYPATTYTTMPIVKGGGLSYRIGQKWREELGLEWKDMPSTDVHKLADKEHTDMIWGVFERHVTDERAYGSVVAGAQESLEIDRAYRLALAVAMEGIE